METSKKRKGLKMETNFDMIYKSIEHTQSELREFRKEIHIIKTMEKEIKPLFKNIGSIQEELKEIRKEIQSFRTELLELGYRCETVCDKKFISRDNFSTYFKNEMEKYQDKKLNKANNKTNIVRNVIQIVITITPYLIMLLGFWGISQKL